MALHFDLASQGLDTCSVYSCINTALCEPSPLITLVLGFLFRKEVVGLVGIFFNEALMIRELE